MSDLKLEVGLKISDSEVDQSIRTMQDKLKRLQQATGADLSPQAQQQQVGQSRAMQDMQKRYVEDLSGKHQQIQKTMSEIDKLYQNQMLGDKSRVAMQEKLLELKRQEKQVVETMKTAGVTPPGQVPPGQVPAGGVPQQPPRPPASSELVDTFKTLLKTVSVAAIVNGALNVAQNMIRTEGRVIQAEASAMQAAGVGFQEQMQGQGVRSAFFAEEREQAMSGALRQREGQRDVDRGRAGLMSATGVIAGAGLGFKAGSALGSAIVPGLGTALGGAAGAVIGGAAGAFSPALHERSRLSMFDPESYEKMLESETMQDFKQREEALKIKNYKRTMAMERFDKDQPQMLQFSRATGLGTEGIYGQRGAFDPMTMTMGDDRQGFLESQMRFGGGDPRFSQQTIMRNAQQMMDAGVSAEELRSGDLAGMSAAAQQRGIAGAPQALGRIAGAGDEVKTDDAFHRLMTEAVKAGVDASSMPDKMNEFITITSELATKGGGFSGSVAEMFGAGLTDMSREGMKASKGVVEDFLQTAGDTAGVSGDIGYGFLTGSESEDILGEDAAANLKGDFRTLRMLNKLTIKDLETDPKLAEKIARNIGLGTEGSDKITDLVRKKDFKKQTIEKDYESSLEELDELQSIPMVDPERLEDAEFKAMKAGSLTDPNLLQGVARRRSRLALLSSEGRTGDTDFMAPDFLTQRPGGALEAREGARGADDISMIQNVSKYVSEIEDNAKKYSENTAMYNRAFDEYISAVNRNKDSLKEYNEELKVIIQDLKSSTPAGFFSGAIPLAPPQTEE
jgi:hypothetical protein